MTVRVTVRVRAADVKKGDRFANATVYGVRVRKGLATIYCNRELTRGRAYHPDTTLIVSRAVRPKAGDYVRHDAVNRATGTRVQVLDLEHHDAVVRPDTSAAGYLRWGVLCVDHGGFIHHADLRGAIGWASAPHEWCPVCSGEQDEETL